MEDWINIPVAAVQSKTTSPREVQLWINICIKRVDFSLGPRHGVGPFISWSSRETRFCRISSLDTSTPCRSRAGTGWNENLEAGLPGMVLTTNVIPKRIVCHGSTIINSIYRTEKFRTPHQPMRFTDLRLSYTKAIASNTSQLTTMNQIFEKTIMWHSWQTMS